MFGELFDIVTAPVRVAVNLAQPVVEVVDELVIKPTAEVANAIVEETKDLLK